MTHIDEPRLETDLGYRFHYLCEFMGFSAPESLRVPLTFIPLVFLQGEFRNPVGFTAQTPDCCRSHLGMPLEELVGRLLRTV